MNILMQAIRDKKKNQKRMMSLSNNTKDATSGTGNATTLPKHPSSPPVCRVVSIAQSLVFCVIFCLSFWSFWFDHCIVCPSNYGFWLFFRHLQAFLTIIFSFFYPKGRSFCTWVSMDIYVLIINLSDPNKCSIRMKTYNSVDKRMNDVLNKFPE
jgi:hypothetical protein